MELKTRIWMNGNLEWFAYINNEEIYLGRREVPMPLAEGDCWTNESGDMFKIIDGVITHLGRTEPPKKFW